MNPFAFTRLRRNLPGHAENHSSRPWRKARDPERILVIRFHAIGDVALALPACLGVRRQYPNAKIDLLTSPAAAQLPNAIRLFDHVLEFEQSGKPVKVLKTLLSVIERLRPHGYEIVLDLQRNWRSRWVRRAVRPQAWAELDRFAMLPACDRTLRVFHEAGLQNVEAVFEQVIDPEYIKSAGDLLRSQGWTPGERLVLLNPAGLWETRNWPLGYYANLARMFATEHSVRFLLLGTSRLRTASHFLAGEIGDRLINLTGRTSLSEALAILHHVDLAITEDSGLMHMAWSTGVPLVALFGSSRHYWSLPTGERVRAFHSGDLACGACMEPKCRFGDNRCLTRVSPEAVFSAAQSLLQSRKKEKSRI